MQSVFGVLVVFLFATTTAASIVSNVSSRIVNGFELGIDQIPYQAILRQRASLGWTHKCGAIVVKNKAVLTAAHCVNQDPTPSSYRIVVGTSFRLEGGINHDVKKIIVHSDYSPSTLDNDIAVIVTKATISFSQYVRPVNIPEYNIIISDGSNAIVSGYGTTAYEGSRSSVLRAAQVTIVAQEVCSRAYIGIASVTSGMICANAFNPSRDACQGDSGGPLVMNGTLIGIVSWGEGCADAYYPGVYTRVSAYSLWLQEKLSDY